MVNKKINRQIIENCNAIKQHRRLVQATKSETHRMYHVFQIRALQRQQERLLARLDTTGLVDNPRFLKDLGI